jgi:hypothetical protein
MIKVYRKFHSSLLPASGGQRSLRAIAPHASPIPAGGIPPAPGRIGPGPSVPPAPADPVVTGQGFQILAGPAAALAHGPLGRAPIRTTTARQCKELGALSASIESEGGQDPAGRSQDQYGQRRISPPENPGKNVYGLGKGRGNTCQARDKHAMGIRSCSHRGVRLSRPEGFSIRSEDPRGVRLDELRRTGPSATGALATQASGKKPNEEGRHRCSARHARRIARVVRVEQGTKGRPFAKEGIDLADSRVDQVTTT